MLDLPFPCDEDFQDDSHLELAERLSRRAWKVANLVLHSDLPWIDIELEINEMRRIVEDERPEKLTLFEQVYAARFHRLREQWRDEKTESCW